MKKLMIAIVFGAIASLTHAASLTWGMTSVAAAGDTAAAAGWASYLMAASTWDTFSSLEDSAKAAYVKENYLATAATTKNSRTGLVSSGATGYGSFAAGDTFEGYSVIFSAADPATAEYIAYSAVKSATVAASGANISISDSFASLTSATGASGGWVAVPEPTSGLLMLLGMAGLALRRRRA